MCSINEIYGVYDPFQVPEFDLVTPGSNHTVLYKIDSGVGKYEPTIGSGDKWDPYHVKMPNSPKCIDIKSTRWIHVKKALCTEITDFRGLLKAILSYNQKFSGVWKFPVLERLLAKERSFEHQFFKKTLPNMQKMALELPNLFQAPIPMLRQHSNHSISMSQQQIACLLANAFFCTYPRRNATHARNEYAAYPKINFSSLFECGDYDSSGALEKLKCLINYFDRVCSHPPEGFVTFTRRYVGNKSCPSWFKSQLPISSIPLHVDSETNIEDALGLIQVDFANKLLGGGVLGNGCVQEEIRFVICPELLVAMLFTEQLDDNEALMVLGCERYSRYTGYGRDNFRFDGDYRDQTPFDGSRRRRSAVLAIDAMKYYDEYAQFDRRHVNRELNKAWIGFSTMNCKKEEGLQRPGIATGNWGCGVFRGHPELKALIQIMACVEARRPMAYYTFLNHNFKNGFVDVYNALTTNQTTVEQLYKMVIKYCDSIFFYSNMSPFKYIHAVLQNNEPKVNTSWHSRFLSHSRNNLNTKANEPTLTNKEPKETSGSSFMAGSMPGNSSFYHSTRNPLNKGIANVSDSDSDTTDLPCMGTTGSNVREEMPGNSSFYHSTRNPLNKGIANVSDSDSDTTDLPCMGTTGSNVREEMQDEPPLRHRYLPHSERKFISKGIASSEPDMSDIKYKGTKGPSDREQTRMTQKYMCLRFKSSCFVQWKFRKNPYPRKHYVMVRLQRIIENRKLCAVQNNVSSNVFIPHSVAKPSM